MPRSRALFWSATVGLLIVALSVATYRYSVATAPLLPLKVPPGDQEIAWFHTATNTATWERFVAGAHYAARQQPRLHVDDSGAFPDLTTAIPELVLSVDGTPQRLRVRWYKQSAQTKVEDWARELGQRDPPPLAILGGGSSDRALEIARVLAAQSEWRGPAPLLLITTATAGRLKARAEGGEFRPFALMSVYPGRTFRFCFTNHQMAQAVIDFVWRQPELRPQGSAEATLSALAAALGGDPWASLGLLAYQESLPGEVFTLEWHDDPYSVDLADQFREVLFIKDAANAPDERPWLGRVVPKVLLDIPSSVGGYLRPNAKEAEVINELINGELISGELINGGFGSPAIPRQPFQRSLLILPAVPQPARRVLGGLTGAAPGIGRQLVAVSGDSISFNHVYRDGALIWNVRLVPVPLVFFTHQNPLAWDDDKPRPEPAEFGLFPPNGTDDVLHFADVVRILAESAYGLTPGHADLLTSADDLAAKLRGREPPFFDADGNRRGGSGEYVIYLRPRLSAESALPSAMLEVWTHRRETGWQRVREPLEVRYR